MKIGRSHAIAVVALLIALTPIAFGPPARASDSPFTPDFGHALPPTAFLNFCARHGSQDPNCHARDNPDAKVWPLTANNLEFLRQVTVHFNRLIQSASDQEIYGVDDYWEYGDDKGRGDCEDYVLAKQRFIARQGWPINFLLITAVFDEHGSAHAVLTVHTDKGDVVLDNRRDDVVFWYETGYTFLIRQSEENPLAWRALDESKIFVSSLQ